jgi:cytochrome P450
VLARLEQRPILDGMRGAVAYASLALNPVQAGHRLHAKHGPAFGIDPPLKRQKRSRRAVFVATEASAERVLENPEHFHSMGLSPVRGPPKSAQRRLRDGMIRMNGGEQTKLRRAYAPSLAKRKICGQEDRLAAIIREEIATWPRGITFDAIIPIKRIVRRAAAAMLFGADDDPEILGIADMLEQHANLQFDLATLMAPAAIPGLPFHRLLRHAELTEAILVDWISRRPPGDNLVARIAGVVSDDGAPLDIRAQAAQFWTLYGASFHTTSTAINWTLLHLAWNPEASRRLDQEIASKGSATPFLDAVVSESLRMSPPVPFQIRRCHGDNRIDGIEVAAGDRVFISSHVMNRDPSVYDRPDCFQPERWMDKEPTAYHPLAFSAGPRRCLGFTFAVAVMKATLAEMWRTANVSILDSGSIGIRLAITQGPLRLPIALLARNGKFPAADFKGGAAWQMSARNLAPAA